VGKAASTSARACPTPLLAPCFHLSKAVKCRAKLRLHPRRPQDHLHRRHSVSAHLRWSNALLRCVDLIPGRSFFMCKLVACGNAADDKPYLRFANVIPVPNLVDCIVKQGTIV
jgi:hypothetical protein